MLFEQWGARISPYRIESCREVVANQSSCLVTLVQIAQATRACNVGTQTENDEPGPCLLSFTAHVAVEEHS